MDASQDASEVVRLKPGDHYFLRVEDDGTEHFAGRPVNPGKKEGHRVLEVSIDFIWVDGSIYETTWTFLHFVNFEGRWVKVYPRGRGWMEDEGKKIDPHSTKFYRFRRHQVEGLVVVDNE